MKGTLTNCLKGNRHRRASQRFRIKESEAWCVSINDVELPSGWIQNISEGGIQFVAPRHRSCEVSQQLRIKITFMGICVFDRVGMLRWQRPGKSSNHIICHGVEFDDDGSAQAGDIIWKKENIKNKLLVAET